MNTYITSKAKRPKNAWYMRISKVIDVYQMDLGYKDTKNRSGPFSSAAHGQVKVPWGPSTGCEYVIRRVEEGCVKEFKFRNKRRETVCFDEVLLNNIENGDGVTPFAQRVTAMNVGDRKRLLGNYLSLIQFAEGFIYHNPSLYDTDGFSLDQSGVSMQVVESNGGSLVELRGFIQTARESATVVNSVKEGHTDMVTKGEKRKVPVGVVKPAKMSKIATALHNQKQEIEDPEGLESQFSKSYLGAAWVPLDNISTAKDLMKIYIFRVYKIMDSLKQRYDPSQAVLVVCPKEGEEVNMEQVEDQEFIVVQKCHTLAAFKELDKTNEFEKLPGHGNRNVLVYIINTNSSALIHYANCRANDIAREHVRTLRPQDLVLVFKSLKDRDGSVNGVKVIERMAKHFRVGVNETTSLLKICKWSSETLKALIAVLEVFEVFETSDVKNSGRYRTLLQRGEKLSMSNSLFNSLAKCDEVYIRENFNSVISKDSSLQELVDNNMKIVAVRKVAGVLSQIAGYKSIDQLNIEHANKFTKSVLANFLGAEVNCDKMNTQAKLLKKYYENVVNMVEDSGEDDCVVKFEEIECLEDLTKSDIGRRFETVIVDLKDFNQNLCLHIINSILKSEKEQNAGVFIFPTEAAQFEVLSFLRTNKLTLADNLKVFPVLFQNDKGGSEEVTENVTFGVAFGKIVVSNPPFKILLGDKKYLLSTVVAQLTVPASSVAIVTDSGLPIVQVHTERLLHKVTYFGTKMEIMKFKQYLAKDKVLFKKAVEVSGKEIVVENVKPNKAVGAIVDRVNNEPSVTVDSNVEVNASDDEDESSTSPFKKDESGAFGGMNDSGIDIDGEAGTSSIKKILKLDV